MWIYNFKSKIQEKHNSFTFCSFLSSSSSLDASQSLLTSLSSSLASIGLEYIVLELALGLIKGPLVSGPPAYRKRERGKAPVYTV